VVTITENGVRKTLVLSWEGGGKKDKGDTENGWNIYDFDDYVKKHPKNTIKVTSNISAAPDEKVWNLVQEQIKAGETGYDTVSKSCGQQAARILKAAGATNVPQKGADARAPTRLYKYTRVWYGLGESIYNE